MKKILSLIVMLLITQNLSAQNLQVLPKNHKAKNGFYKHFTHYKVVFHTETEATKLVAALQKENLQIENSGIVLAKGTNLKP